MASQSPQWLILFHKPILPRIDPVRADGHSELFDPALIIQVEIDKTLIKNNIGPFYQKSIILPVLYSAGYLGMG
jgi:hypothetical protein